jgi:hypothetical protein
VRATSLIVFLNEPIEISVVYPGFLDFSNSPTLHLLVSLFHTEIHLFKTQYLFQCCLSWQISVFPLLKVLKKKAPTIDHIYDAIPEQGIGSHALALSFKERLNETNFDLFCKLVRCACDVDYTSGQVRKLAQRPSIETLADIFDRAKTQGKRRPSLKSQDTLTFHQELFHPAIV